jgi:hypothetical protein
MRDTRRPLALKRRQHPSAGVDVLLDPVRQVHRGQLPGVLDERELSLEGGIHRDQEQFEFEKNCRIGSAVRSSEGYVMSREFWKCARCGYENGPKRDACFRCGTTKGAPLKEEPAEPVKRGSVGAALRATYPDRYRALVSDPIVRESKEYFSADEILDGLLLGRRQTFFIGSGQRGALWATDQRLLWFMPGSPLSSATTESYSYEKIMKVEFTPVLQGQLNIRFVGYQDLCVWYMALVGF